jgi:hypothetical protein
MRDTINVGLVSPAHVEKFECLIAATKRRRSKNACLVYDELTRISSVVGRALPLSVNVTDEASPLLEEIRDIVEELYEIVRERLDDVDDDLW